MAPTSHSGIFSTRIGRGQPLMVLHGGPGWDHSYLRPWLDTLATEAELIFVDLPGNGRSRRPSDWRTVSHESWIEELEQFRLEEGLERLVLLGHSYGGFLAQEYALRHGEALVGLILCSTAPALDYMEVASANAARRGTPDSLEALAQVFSGSFADDAEFGRICERLLPLYFHQPSLARELAPLAATQFRAEAFVHANTRCVPSFSTLERLHQIAVPTLVVSGADDWLMPLAHAAERLIARIPQAEALILDSAGHFPFIEAQDEFAHGVRRWLNTV